MAGIVGLRAGVQFVSQRGITNIFRHELALVQTLYDKLSTDKRIQLYTERPNETHFVPVLSFNIQGANSEEIGKKLSAFGFAVRAGLHCAPAAHRYLGTLEQGTVRICPSVFTKSEEIHRLVIAIKKLADTCEKKSDRNFKK